MSNPLLFVAEPWSAGTPSPTIYPSLPQKAGLSQPTNASFPNSLPLHLLPDSPLLLKVTRVCRT